MRTLDDVKVLAPIIAVGVLFWGLIFFAVAAGCRGSMPHPESVTLVRVDGGFMSCTTFLKAEGDATP